MKQKSRFAALFLSVLFVLPLVLNSIRAEARPNRQFSPPAERAQRRAALRRIERNRSREVRYNRDRSDRGRYDRNQYDRNRDSRKGRDYQRFVAKRERDMRRQNRRR